MKDSEKGKQMIDYFKDKMCECLQLIEKDHTEADGSLDPNVKEILRNMDYKDPNKTDYKYDERLSNAVYLVKYGCAYAYEYSVIYRIVLDDFKGDLFGVTSLGCGSCIDAWSLAYAKEKAEKDIPIRYFGADINEWGIRFEPEDEPRNQMRLAYEHGKGYVGMRYPGNGTNPDNIINIFKKDDWQERWPYKYNMLLFPKILNELSDDCLDELIDCIREKADRFEFIEHYICISHSKDKYDTNSKMKTIAKKICDAINYDDRFEVNDVLPKDWPGDKGRKLVDESSEGDFACYSFPKNQNNFHDEVSYLDDAFVFNKEDENEKLYEKIRDKINNFMESEGHRKCVTSTSTSLFQIIKLTPRGERL